jgi:hypothetical protein
MAGPIMKAWLLLAATLPTMLGASAWAETAIQPGLWEKTEKVTVDNRELPSQPRSVCLKAGEASLERLLLINDDEATARGCKSEVTPAGAGLVRMSMSCPASADEPAVVARLEVRFTATSFDGTGSVEIKPKDGPAHTGMSALSGKRRGDC